MKYTQLKEHERFYVEQRLAEGDSIRQIAKTLERSHSTIIRETKRNTLPDFKGVYSFRLAIKLAQEKRAQAKFGQAFVTLTPNIKKFIHERLETHTSPDVISGELKVKHNKRVSESSIYRYINADKKNGGKLYESLPHRGKPYKTKSNNGQYVKIKNRVGIEHRPKIADEKTEIGHFEIDTIVGKDHKSYLLTVVDKASKITCIRKMPNKLAQTVVDTFIDVVKWTFYDFKTITADNGSEFAAHEAITKVTGAPVYFARPYRSCDRGLNEHTNGLIRRFLPKKTDFNQVSDTEIARIEHILNTRGRASLGYYSPNDVFLKHLMAG